EIDSDDDWVSKPSHDVQDWKFAIDELKEVHEEMMVTLATLEDSILDTNVPGTKYRFELMIRGVIMHDVYHLGQLALLNAAFSKN
ncbi:MAG: DinB family protein, partial [Ignavibacteriaceae bacterium]|nr:DinB family protein [Ignavibacteriaceae bacterium]